VGALFELCIAWGKPELICLNDRRRMRRTRFPHSAAGRT
jgi:hypothetical protein